MRNTFNFHKNQFADRVEYLQQYLDKISEIKTYLKEKLIKYYDKNKIKQVLRQRAASRL